MRFFTIMAEPHTAQPCRFEARLALIQSQQRISLQIDVVPLQCFCLSTDRATINQGNRKKIWERLCSKSHCNHKCTTSKCFCSHCLTLFHAVLCWLSFVLVSLFWYIMYLDSLILLTLLYFYCYSISLKGNIVLLLHYLYFTSLLVTFQT